LDPPEALRGHPRGRGAPAARPGGPDPQGGRLDAARGGQARRRGARGLPAPPPSRDAAHDAALRDRALPRGEAEGLAQGEGLSRRPPSRILVWRYGGQHSLRGAKRMLEEGGRVELPRRRSPPVPFRAGWACRMPEPSTEEFRISDFGLRIPAARPLPRFAIQGAI